MKKFLMLVLAAMLIIPALKVEAVDIPDFSQFGKGYLTFTAANL